MGDQLRVDTKLLREAGASLRVVATEFEHANANSEDVADAVGHHGLAGKIHEFADNWDDKRGKMMEDIQQLAEAAKGTGEAFERLDTELAASLRGEK